MRPILLVLCASWGFAADVPADARPLDVVILGVQDQIQDLEKQASELAEGRDLLAARWAKSADLSPVPETVAGAKSLNEKLAGLRKALELGTETVKDRERIDAWVVALATSEDDWTAYRALRPASAVISRPKATRAQADQKQASAPANPPQGR